MYGIFIEGETKGKKMRPEQVEKILRQKLQVLEYVTSKTIRLLFSRWSKNLLTIRQNNVDNPQNNNDSDDKKR